ncbi:sugar ABC transporter ATP-binding protein [Rhodococcus sp. ACS1]|nr:sugar ABC transporter ATP-binding protein [Rhodococcus sp. ACS1]
MNDLLELSSLSMTFDSGRALDGADLSLTVGEIHGLVGQNGCGKSTLIKILSGYHFPDPGAEGTFLGAPLPFGDPSAPHRVGIHFVHQDLGLVDGLSVVENLALGSGYATGPFGNIRWRRQIAATREATHALGYELDPHTDVSKLSPSERVGVAISRALINDSSAALRLLVLDEPTAALPPTEVQRLFAVLQRLRERGVTTLFVSHRLDELLTACDRVTVLRSGRRVSTAGTSTMTRESLIRDILGRPLVPHKPTNLSVNSQEPSVTVRRLTGTRLKPLDFDVYPGEVLGLVGVTGSGREEVASLIVGATEPIDGSVTVHGSTYSGLNPHTASRAGIAFLPTDRRRSAVIPDATVRENLTLPMLADITRLGHISRRAESRVAGDWIGKMQVRPSDPENLAINLSGGNQQKVLLARWLRTKPKMLILDEPTQGIDVGTKTQFYALLSAAARDGIAVVVCTTDGQEAVELCDRVLVLADGVCTRSLTGSSLTTAVVEQELLGLPENTEKDEVLA